MNLHNIAYDIEAYYKTSSIENGLCRICSTLTGAQNNSVTLSYMGEKLFAVNLNNVTLLKI